MKIGALHSWDLKPVEAVALQRELASRVDARTPLGRWEIVAGADVSYNRFSPILYAAVVVLRTADWTILETQETVGRASFPYIPGLLTFREAPILLELFSNLKTRPDAVILDGQGQAHPRRLGFASHVGLWLDVPCVGCAKSRLVGSYREPGKRPGSMSPLRDGNEVIGSIVRTKKGVKPVYVSVGNRIDLASAIRLVLHCCQGYRLPEPTRQAHLLVNALRRQGSG
jgi:deoxyribonuclease V